MIFHSRRCLGLFLLGALLVSCHPGVPGSPPLSSEVTAHTGGLISRQDPVHILFTRDLSDQERQGLVEGRASIEPQTPGTWSWDGRTLSFRPAAAWPAGGKYLVKVGAVGELHGFDFGFQVLTQRISVRTLPPGATADAMELSGVVTSVDLSDPAQVEKSVKVVYQGRQQTLRWEHPAGNFEHRFAVSGLAKGAQVQKAEVVWDGAPVGAPDRGNSQVEIPAQGTFQLLAATPSLESEGQIDLAFSEPLKPNQDLRGLVTVQGTEDLRYGVRGNRISVYAPEPWIGPQLVSASPGIQSITGKTLSAVTASKVAFEHPAPSVKFVGTGAILPSSQNQTVPIETVNVDTILVEALQVYDDNALQFFQVNQHNGRAELARVGKVVWRDVVSLDFRPEDQDKTVRRGLDLSPLMKKNPQGFLVLKVSVRRQHIRWDNHVGRNEFREDPLNWEPAFAPGDGESSYWDYWDDINTENVYQERENPLSQSYYLPRWGHSVRDWRNVMVSDLGLMAKAGEDGALTLTASNLLTAQPREAVALTVYDFQRQPLWTGKTGKDGQVTAKLTPNAGDPAFVGAVLDHQKGYLKLDRPLQLAVSSFDVGGAKIEKGINGFLYGERGVWRPGDPLHVTFILEDPAKTLPLNYPVVFELRTPQGDLADKQVKTLGVNGMYTFHTGTQADASTGDWTGRVSVAGKTFEKTLKVETIQPNRLKIDLKWNGTDSHLRAGKVKGTLTSRWLHGAPASGLRAESRLTLNSVPTVFDRWDAFTFDDPQKAFMPHSQPVFEDTLDDSGKAAVLAELDAGDSAPGRLQALFYTKVYEPSGAFSSTVNSFFLDPFREYVGLQLPKGDAIRGMLLTDTDHTAKLVLVDPLGNPVPSGTVQMSLIKLKWRWWWETGPDTNPEYVSETQNQVLSSGTVNISKGTGEWKFRLAYPEWGRFLVKAEDSLGHTTGKIVYIDWPGWAGRSNGEGGGGANLLAVTTDKTKYQVGDTVSVSFPTNPKGKAWVTLEAAGKVLKSEWVAPAAGETTVYQFAATPEMAPNLYVHVTFVQPHQQTANDLPIRVYGIVPVAVEDPNSRVQPVLIADPVMAPLSRAKITVKEASGRPMTYTLAVVDEGLLGITGFQTPDPWRTFFSRRASLLRSWDLYDWVSGAWTGSLQNILTVGGDTDKVDNSKTKINRFPPLVRFFDPTVLAAGETKTHWIDLPAYVGEVRIMAVAAYKRTYGRAERSATVKSPLMVLPTLPRVLTPGESFTMPLSIFAYNGQDQVDVSVKTEGSVSVVGDSAVSVSTKGKTEVLASLPLVTGTNPGTAKVTVSVSKGNDSATQVTDLEVRLPSAPLTKEVVGPLLKPGETWTSPVQAFGYPGTARATLEVSQLKSLGLERRLADLVQYPHGCVEQTTSAVFPQLYLNSLVNLTDDRRKQIDANVTAGIQRLKQFQTANGALAYWPGQAEPHLWGSNYAGHFLVEAKKAGYAVPQDLYSRWLAFETKTAAGWSESDQDSSFNQAYRLYVLSLSGSPDLGAMNRLKEKTLSGPARYLLAAAYQSVGQASMAGALLQKEDGSVKPAKWWEETFGSEVRDLAIELAVAVDLKDDARADRLYNKVADEVGRPNAWLSTQSTAWALAACSRYLGWQVAPGGAHVDVVWGKETSTVALSRSAFTKTQSVTGSESVKVTNTGSVPVTPRLGVTANPRPGEESGGESGLSLMADFDAAKGSFDRAPSGSEIVVTLTVRNKTRLDQNHLALSFLAPSGWELQNPRLTGETADSGLEYQDFRDDRVLSYFSLKAGEMRQIQLKATATYQGKFYFPVIQVESMYDGTVYARHPGSWVSVLPPGPQ